MRMSENWHNNSDNPLTSRRTDGGKKIIGGRKGFWLALLFCLPHIIITKGKHGLLYTFRAADNERLKFTILGSIIQMDSFPAIGYSSHAKKINIPLAFGGLCNGRVF